MRSCVMYQISVHESKGVCVCVFVSGTARMIRGNYLGLHNCALLKAVRSLVPGSTSS